MSASAKTIEHETGMEVQPATGGALTPIELTARALEKGLDAEQLGKFMDLQERHEANEARKAYAAAMSRFQASCPPIPKVGKARVTTKSGGSYEYKFPPLDTIQATIKPHLDVAGLSYQFTDTKLENSELSLVCVVLHEAGHSERFPFAVPVDDGLHINKMQKVGVANSYAKRYALCNALSLVGFDPDTDGNQVNESGYITREEGAALLERLEAVDADVAAFCEFMGVSEVWAIPKNQHPRALGAVRAKEKKVGEK